MRTHAVRALAALLPAVLLLGACGEKTSSGALGGLTPGARVAAAAVKTAAAKSARIHMVMKMTGLEEPDSPPEFTMTADGRSELSRPRAVITMDMGSLMPGFEGFDGKMEMRLIDTVAYMKFPDLGEGFPMAKGKRWIKMDFGAMGKESGFDISDLQNFGFGDPAEILSFLKDVGTVSVAGSQQIRGEKTTHYKATINFSKLIDKAVGEAVDAEARKEIEKFAASMKSVPADVWIGEDGILRRLDLTMDFSGIEEMGKSAKMAMSLEMYDFGVSVVDVVAPPAAEIMDFEKMMDQMPVEPAA